MKGRAFSLPRATGPVIVHINHISQSKKAKGNQRSPQSELASLVTGSLMSMVEEGVLDAHLAPSLRIHLDWIQYKTNFRDPVIVRRTTNPQGQILPLAEIAIDLRQANATSLPDELAQAVRELPPQMSRAFRMHKLEGMSQAATAEAMGVSVKTVEHHIQAAIKQLAQRLRT